MTGQHSTKLYFTPSSLDEELKVMENGGRRWPPNSEAYLSYIREQEDKRRRSLLLSMHSKCCERWFLLQLMKKYAGNVIITIHENSRF